MATRTLHCDYEQPIGPDSVQSLIDPCDPDTPKPLTNRNEIPTTQQPYKVTRSTLKGNSPRGAVSSTERPGSTYRAQALRRHRDTMRSAFHAPAHSCYCTSHHDRSFVLSYVARRPYARLPRSDLANLRRPGAVWSLGIRYFSLAVCYSPVR